MDVILKAVRPNVSAGSSNHKVTETKKPHHSVITF